MEEENIEQYYQENKEDIIQQFRKDMDEEHLSEDDDTLENWYKPCLLEIAQDWMEQENMAEHFNKILEKSE